MIATNIQVLAESERIYAEADRVYKQVLIDAGQIRDDAIDAARAAYIVAITPAQTAFYSAVGGLYRCK